MLRLCWLYSEDCRGSPLCVITVGETAMTVAVFIMQIVLIAVISVAGYLARNFLTAYTGKKGENLATKEDIAEITEKVEAVKSLYAHETEHLRSSLAVVASQRTAIAEQRRATLLQFFDHCSELLSDKLSMSLGNFPVDQGQSLTNYEQSVRHLITAIILDHQRILLYSEPDSNLPAIAQGVLTSSMEIRAAFERHFYAVKRTLIEEGNAYASGDRTTVEQAVRRSDEAGKAYRAALLPHTGSMLEHLTAFMRALNAYLHTQNPEESLKYLKEAASPPELDAAADSIASQRLSSPSHAGAATDVPKP
jgi:hypothetical protein